MSPSQQPSSWSQDLLTNPASHYNVGWSHGKEALKSGQYDTLKGSYYATIISSYLRSQFQHSSAETDLKFEHPNVWPPEQLIPDFRRTFEELCVMIVDIAQLVARACDRFAMEFVQGYEQGGLERVVKESMTNRARLLHYFPPPESLSGTSGNDEEPDDSWCALHVDDGCLTGLTSALFINESISLPPLTTTSTPSTNHIPAFKESPDPLAGLYIRSRTSDVVKVNIPLDCLAFQTGSALELMTGGVLKAVPHFVRGPSVNRKTGKVARNTLAVFTQPNLDEIVDVKTGLTFREHIRMSDEKHA
ncbi:hypothetical protein EG329_002265 [Mollisiaceae sp. DMI_Dod_QoI]|nr:hypothetical protein EG329_002265 [Helotiales sp. DMI_Dod_QoI]